MKTGVLSKFVIVLTILFMLVGFTSTTTYAQSTTIDVKQGKKIVQTVVFTNEELLKILNEENFDKEVIQSYRNITGISDSSTSDSAQLTSKKSLTSSLELSNIQATSYATPNFIRKYSDGSIEIGLNKETLRWGAIIGTAAFCGVLAAIPGVGWTIASAVAGVIIGYASSLIPRGYSFAFVRSGAFYYLYGVYPIAGY